jgi:uncharacterized protein (TIGR03663 family)
VAQTAVSPSRTPTDGFSDRSEHKTYPVVETEQSNVSVPGSSLQGVRSRVEDRTVAAVLGLTALALAVRLYALGRRVAQYDEAWIGHWILRYAETGVWEYDPMYHGSFLPQVNRHLVGLLGFSDAVGRLPVALVGGSVPLTALLLRHRLRDSEAVALAALLAGTPLLVYYSRFMRFDVLLAAFAFATLAFAVAAVDREDPRYLYPAGACLALTTTTKESFLLYLLAWAGAGAVVADSRILARRRSGVGVRESVRSAVDRLRGVPRFRRAAVGSAALAVVVVVYFYAPRPDLWAAPTDPARIPGVVGAATLGSAGKLYDFWVAGGMQEHPYLPYLSDYLATLVESAAVVLAFAPVGFVVDRYAGRDRALVAFCTLWGVAFVVGYPLANFLPTPWSAVHAAVALAVPAAVGIAALYRAGRDSRLRTAAAVGILVFATVGTGATVVATSYQHPQDGAHEVVYHSQPAGRMKPALAAVRTAVDGHDGGPDVLYYGSWYDLPDESIADRPPAYAGWHRRLPFPWYFEGFGATVNSTTSLRRVVGTAPPVVVARARHRPLLVDALEGYAHATYDLSQTDRATVVLVDADRIPEEFYGEG